MDFEALRASRFYQIGRWVNDEETGESSIVEQSVFDTVPFSHSEISNLKQRDFSNNGPTVAPSLHKLLDPVIMPVEMRDLIVDQWTEVSSIIDTVGKKSFNSLLIIQPPGAFNPKHKHRSVTKRTITFCYKYDEDRIIDEMKSKLRIELEEGKETVIMYPDVPKTLMLFTDNYPHKSISYEWRFYWVYDFDEHVDIPKDVFATMSDWNVLECC